MVSKCSTSELLMRMSGACLLLFLCASGCASRTQLLHSIANDPHETGRQWVWPYFLAGKPTVLAFWNTDNMQCLRDVAAVKTLESRDSAVQLVTVVNGVSPFEIEKWLQKENIDYVVLLDLDRTFSERMKVDSEPQFILFNVDGEEVTRAYDVRVVHNWFDRKRWAERAGVMADL